MVWTCFKKDETSWVTDCIYYEVGEVRLRCREIWKKITRSDNCDM